MIIIAGGIGTGKSIVSRILRLKGWGVYDCDLRARELMEENEDVRRKLIEVCGSDIYDSANRLQRSLLASRLFENKKMTQQVNSIVHEEVRKDIGVWLKSDAKNLFVETAISIESGLADLADEIWIVESELTTRIERVEKRDGRTVEQIRKIINIQEKEETALKELEKPIKRIYNNSSNRLLSQIDDLLNLPSASLTGCRRSALKADSLFNNF